MGPNHRSGFLFGTDVIVSISKVGLIADALELPTGGPNRPREERPHRMTGLLLALADFTHHEVVAVFELDQGVQMLRGDRTGDDWVTEGDRLLDESFGDHDADVFVDVDGFSTAGLEVAAKVGVFFRRGRVFVVAGTVPAVMTIPEPAEVTVEPGAA